MLADTAVILAGGKSSRMGFDKQCIRLNGELLIKQQIDILHEIFEEIVIVTNKPELYKSFDCTLTADILEDFGPLGGIHAGLKAANSQFSYLIACDMPVIKKEYILYMQKMLYSASQSPEAVITRFGNWLEPFNAFYSSSLIRHIEQAYENKDRKIGSLLQKSKVFYIEEADARKFSPDWSMFMNINTEDDLENLENSVVNK